MAAPDRLGYLEHIPTRRVPAIHLWHLLSPIEASATSQRTPDRGGAREFGCNQRVEGKEKISEDKPLNLSLERLEQYHA